jgi:hypothetical protein
MLFEPVELDVRLEELVSKLTPYMGLPGGHVEVSGDAVRLESTIELDRLRWWDPNIFVSHQYDGWGLDLPDVF